MLVYSGYGFVGHYASLLAGIEIGYLKGSSFKKVFHTLSYCFAAIISLRFYSSNKGMNDYGQGGIADTLTLKV